MGEIIPNIHLDQFNKPGYTSLIEDFNQRKFIAIFLSITYMIATIYGRNSNRLLQFMAEILT